MIRKFLVALAASLMLMLPAAPMADAGPTVNQENCDSWGTQSGNALWFHGHLKKAGWHIDCAFWASLSCSIYFWGEWHTDYPFSGYKYIYTNGYSMNHYLACPSSWTLNSWSVADWVDHNI